MKKIMIILIILSLLLASCTTGETKVSTQSLNNGFPILEEYKELAQLEKGTEYEFDGLIRRSITGYFMDALYMQVYSAMILTNMMSENTIEKAIDIKSNNGDLIKGLSIYNRRNIEHLTRVAERTPEEDPIQEWHSLILSYLKFLNYDVMANLQENYGNVIGACADISSMNVAMMRLMGVEPEDVVLLTIPEHAITSFSYKGDDYLSDNAYFLKHKDHNIYNDTMGMFQDVDYGQLPDYNKVIGICNDAYYTTGFTMEGRMTQEAYEGFIERYDFKEKYEADINYFQLEPDKKGFPTDFPHVNIEIKKGDKAKDISENIVNQVYTLSKDTPESQYTLAKYGYQTLIVKHPEFYVSESAKTQLTKKYSKELSTSKDMINYINENIEGGSIFKEAHRIMDPEEVIVTGKGGPKDKALLLKSFMINNDIPAYILFTDEKSYVVFNENGWKIFDTTTMDLTKNIEGKLTLIFNEEEVKYPLMDRDDLGDKIQDFLTDLNLIDSK
ncbi:MAG: hypothetical protein FH761_15580 [Firmicutes bacterium]|nr:hypothetical protein [Bacillota bacterium]